MAQLVSPCRIKKCTICTGHATCVDLQNFRNVLDREQNLISSSFGMNTGRGGGADYRSQSGIGSGEFGAGKG